MKTYNLPDDLNSGIAFKNDEVIIRQYQSGHNSTTKNKIILSQNMISLVLSGSKTVIYPESIATVNEGDGNFVYRQHTYLRSRYRQY